MRIEPLTNLVSDLHHALAAVLAGQKSDQGGGCVLKALNNVLLDFQLAGLDPNAQIGNGAIALVEIVRNDEAFAP